MAKPGTPNLHPAQLLQEAVALHRQGRLDEAERLYNRVLKADRNEFDALHLLGMLNHQRGKTGEAYRLLVAALKAQPRSADALANFGMVLHALKRNDEALAQFDKALAAAPGHIDALNNRGNVLVAQGRVADALRDFEQILLRDPRHVQARINRGAALARLGEPGRALAEFDAALALHPANPGALYNRGTALGALGRHAEAVAAFDRALALVPRYAAALYNRGLSLQSLNRHREAIDSFRKTREVHPDHGDAAFGEAASLLTLGDYGAGFAVYEARWMRSGMSGKSRFRQPLWLGESPLAGRTILLHAEQGLGDTIQFARYAPLLARAGARVVLEAQPELKTLLAGLDGVSGVIARGESLPAFDLHCPLASLPLAWKTELASVPADIPYLRVGEAALAAWRPRLEQLPGRKVALAWAGRASHANDANRSIDLALLEPLFSLPGMSFVSIQRELRPRDAERLAAARVTHLGDDLHDFTDTAAVLAACDLTVCVDTSVAHLAGALGRPLWVLLPFQPDWRWTLNAERTPWYPAARLFRQPAPGDWDSVCNQLREALASGARPVT